MTKGKPKTDEEARASCVGCRRFDGVRNCELNVIGVITVRTRQICFDAKYADRRLNPRPAGKLPHYPPCP